MGLFNTTSSPAGLSGPVAAALDSGIDPQRVVVAAHEVGHAIAWRAAGFTIDHLALRIGWRGGVAAGYCQLGDLWLDADNAYGYLIGLAAGAAAEERAATRQLGRSTSAARSAARSGASYDHREFRRLARAHGSRLTVETAQQRAAALLSRHSARLDNLTARLARTCRIPGRAV